MAFSHSAPASEPAPTAIDLAEQDPEKHLEGATRVERTGSASEQHVDHHHIIDPALERKIVRKMDLRLVPLVTVMCMLCYLPCPPIDS